MYRFKQKLAAVTASVGIIFISVQHSAFAAQGQPGMPPAQVYVTVAEERLMVPQMDVSGAIISLNDSRISAEVEGRLVWVADVGLNVQKGDVIARVNTRLLVVAVDRATASLKKLQADLVYRNQVVARYQELAASNNASKANLEEAISRRNMLKYDIADAEAMLSRATGDKARAEIKAPFSGHVVARLASKGEYLIVGDEVVRLVDTHNLEVVIPAPLAIKPFLRVGEFVTVYDARGTHSLPIRTVVPVGDSISRMIEVRLSASAGDWIVGTPVKVSLPKGNTSRSVAVPRDALILKGGAMYLYRVGADNKAQKIRADIGDIVGLWVSIKSEIAVGDRIVIRGGERLQADQTVVIMDAAITSASN